MYFFNRYCDAEELWGGLQPIYPILQQQIQEAGFPTTYTHFTETGYRLDHLSVYDWIERYIHGGYFTHLCRMLVGGCRGCFGLDTVMVSSRKFVFMLSSGYCRDERNCESA